MNNLSDDFEKLKMISTNLDNLAPQSPSPIFGRHTSLLTNTPPDLVDAVNSICIHMEVKNQIAIDSSMQSNDIFKLVEHDSNEYALNKENFIQLLRTYKAYLDENRIEKARRQVKSLQNQYSLEEEEDAMETENRFEFNNSGNGLNDNKEILYEIKSFIRKNKFKTESDEDIDNAFDDSHELIDESSDGNDEDNDILPRNLIVTSLPIQVFSDFDTRLQFERIFTDIDAKCNFCYFRLFKRCCIQYEDSISAVLARFELENLSFLNESLKIFLTKPIKLKNSRTSLQPPENDKAFLISPPSSPPVGWEQVHEDPPVVNIELLAALSKLNPREPCELIKSQDNIPGIVIHPCSDSNETLTSYGGQKKRFIQTRRPNPNDFS